MSEYQEFTGRTVEEAIRSARESFGVSGLDDLDFEILTPGSRGVLGMGAEPARIIAAPRSALGGAATRRDARRAAAARHRARPRPAAPPPPRDAAPRPPRERAPAGAAPSRRPPRQAETPPAQQAGSNTSVPLRGPPP